MPGSTAEETIELDLTICGHVLRAPSERSAGAGSDDPTMGKFPLTVETNCGTDVWDCTAPWVCG